MRASWDTIWWWWDYTALYRRRLSSSDQKMVAFAPIPSRLYSFMLYKGAHQLRITNIYISTEVLGLYLDLKQLMQPCYIRDESINKNYVFVTPQIVLCWSPRNDRSCGEGVDKEPLACSVPPAQQPQSAISILLIISCHLALYQCTGYFQFQ
jgi:hypothetical protein